MFPGCGSAWYRPSRSTWSRNDCSRRPASTFAGSGVGFDRGVVGDGHAVDLLHHQHPSRRQRLVHLRRGDAVVALEVVEERDAAGCLGAVVELALERRDELLGQPLHPELTRRLDAAVDDPRRHPQHGGVAVDDVLDAGPLHLHHDVLAGLEDRAVRLADRGRRQRLEVERRELLLDRRAELALEHLAHLVGVDRARGRLELRELAW